MEYRRHGDYLRLVARDREMRAVEISKTIEQALGKHIVERPAREIEFKSVTGEELSGLLLDNPKLLKPLIAVCNMGQRAIRKDLGISVESFRPRLTAAQADAIARYLLPSLPPSILVESLVALDAYQYVDSAIRTIKGRWEKRLTELLLSRGVDAKKRKFVVEDEKFEIDIAYPSKGDIQLAVDAKMIGDPLDKHKRIDEIANKADKFKKVYPQGRFVALIYYPNEDDRPQLEARLRKGSPKVDVIVFAGDDEDSLRAALDTVYAEYEKLGADASA